MSNNILARGAEAVLIQKDNLVIKQRIKKSYRLPQIDDKLRKLRTRQESRILEKVSSIINVPKVLETDEQNKEITMQFIEGKRLSDHLESLDYNQICQEIGKSIAKLHDSDIIHGDLTTSNMILENKSNQLFFIDFGLSFHSSRIEDKAVDLHLIKQALEAKHHTIFKECFSSVLEGYMLSSSYEKTLSQLKKVEARGRYKH